MCARACASVCVMCVRVFACIAYAFIRFVWCVQRVTERVIIRLWPVVHACGGVGALVGDWVERE